jgi:CheY-like chemotaxis protein/Arc/MetJ family transcription regulator
VTPKLLLADDSVTIQRVIELTFADEDVQVVAVGDGQQAIDRVQADRPDIVLADVGMPERDGYEVAAFIKGNPRLSHIPVLLLTGAFEPIDEVRARAVGCDGVLVKPFEPQMVISRVRDLLSGQRSAPHAVEPAAAAPATAAGSPVEATTAAPPAASPFGSGGASLEDYFDRLDAALASKGASGQVPPVLQATPVATTAAVRPPAAPPRSPAPSPHGQPLPPAPSKPHADLDLAGWDPSAAAEPPRQGTEAAPSPPPPGVVAPVAATPAQAPPAAAEPLASAPTLQEAFSALLAAEQGFALTPAAPRVDPTSPDVVDEIVKKVIARLGDDTMRAAVLDAAERLVREEIERIKNTR